MKKTTVYLPDELKAALEREAAARGQSEAELIREAVRRLTWDGEQPKPRLPLFSSGQDPTLAERVDEELKKGLASSVAATILDTSGLLAAMDADQRSHWAAREALEGVVGPRILSPFVLAELDYLLRTSVGAEAALALLDEVARGVYRLEPFSASDVAEAKAVIEQYAGFGDIGLADASNVVLARRHDTRDILTLDERHFRALRGPRDLPFRLLPADS